MQRQIQTQKTRQRIIETAKKLFSGNSYSQVTMRRIAEESGLGLGTFYQHFRSKRDILLELTAQLNEEIADRLDAQPDWESLAAPEQYLRFVEIYCGVLRCYRGIETAFIQGILEEEVSGQTIPGIRRMLARLEQICDQGVACGAFHPLIPTEAFVRQYLITAFGSAFYRHIKCIEEETQVRETLENALGRLLPLLIGVK